MSIQRAAILWVLGGHGLACLHGCAERSVDLGDWRDATAPDSEVAVDAGRDATDTAPEASTAATPDGASRNPPECPPDPPVFGSEPCTVGRGADGGCLTPSVVCTYPNNTASGTPCETMSCFDVDQSVRWGCGSGCP